MFSLFFFSFFFSFIKSFLYSFLLFYIYLYIPKHAGSVNWDSELTIDVNVNVNVVVCAYVGPVVDWRPVQAVPHLLSNVSWDHNYGKPFEHLFLILHIRHQVAPLVCSLSAQVGHSVLLVCLFQQLVALLSYTTSNTSLTSKTKVPTSPLFHTLLACYCLFNRNSSLYGFRVCKWLWSLLVHSFQVSQLVQLRLKDRRSTLSSNRSTLFCMVCTVTVGELIHVSHRKENRHIAPLRKNRRRKAKKNRQRGTMVEFKWIKMFLCVTLVLQFTGKDTYSRALIPNE